MNKVDPIYGKDMATITSGIAILLMIMHHFFGWPILYKDGITYTSIFGNLNVDGIPIEQSFAGYCKICVSIYAFNTGYAIWTNKEVLSYSKIRSKIIKFITSYWVIYLLFIAYAFIVNENLPPLKNFLLNLIGMGGSHKFVNISSAWYVPFYITILLITPALIRIFRLKFALNCIISLCLILAAFLLDKYIKDTNTLTYILSTICNHLCHYLSSVLVGIFVCKYSLFEKIDKVLGGRNILLYILLIAATIFIRPYFPKIGGNKDAILVVILLYSIISIIRSLNSNKIKSILTFLGIYSMNMWFVQPIFYTGKYDILQQILFYPKYSILIYIWCVILVLLIAIGCTYIQKYIFNLYKWCINRF